MRSLQDCDPTIAFQLWLEQARQDNCLHLTIALNYLSQAAFDARFTAAIGSLGWRATPVDGHKLNHPRSVVDTVRHVASQRACRLFNAEYACVTPVSGLEARAIVQYATLRYGDAIFDLSASCGRSTLRVMRVNAIGQLDCVTGCWIDDGRGQIDRDALACRMRTYTPAMLRVTATPDWTPVEWDGLAAVANNAGAYFAVDLTHFAARVRLRRACVRRQCQAHISCRWRPTARCAARTAVSYWRGLALLPSSIVRRVARTVILLDWRRRRLCSMRRLQIRSAHISG
ncbi:hypothetical protein CY652_14015 [Burkholderia sp. WAC0059]|nr:hypothetical protein CY652_14015 [Burkholderia sp. WAC0059]